MDASSGSSTQGSGVNGDDPVKIWAPRFPLSVLTKQNRVDHMIGHRKGIKSVMKMLVSQSGGRTVSRSAGANAAAFDLVNPGGLDHLPNFIRQMPTLQIRDMDPYECQHHDGKITLEIVEDAESFMRVMLLGQDKRGDVVYVAFYNDNPNSQDNYLQEKVGYGCTITIAQPLMKIALDGRTMIRIDEDDDLFIHKAKDIKKCRFCQKPNSPHRCARCQKAYYCSKECQTKDWEVLKHKNLCDAYSWINSHMS